MRNPVTMSESDSRASKFATEGAIQAANNASNAGAIGGMVADIGLSLLSVIPIGGAAVSTAKEGVKIAKEGVKAAKEGVKIAKEGVRVAKAAGEGLSAAKETLKAARTVGVMADGVLKPGLATARQGLATARQGVQAAKASTLGFKVANKALSYGKVGAGLVSNYGQYRSSVATGNTTGAVMAGMGAAGSVTETTISEVQQQQQNK